MVSNMNTDPLYWETRYAQGGNSGEGSIGRYRRWKWAIINRYAPNLARVIDIGCGDLTFWEKKRLPEYIGIDISKTIINRNIEAHPHSKFIHAPAEITIPGLQAPTVLCLDLLFHIMNDAAYTQILKNICEHSTDKIFIYTWMKNPWKNKATDGKYQTFRRLELQLPLFYEQGFDLVERVPCPFDVGAMYVFQYKEVK